MIDEFIERLIDLAIAEDIGDGDHTSLACINKNVHGRAQLLAKQNGIISGVDIAKRVFKKIDSSIGIQIFIHDGEIINKGDIVFVISGKVISLLQAERIVLNIIQRMSGIASTTRKYVDALQGLNTKILDTRKTAPGMRMLEKIAVKTGGGENHRIGLFDMVLIKDNHIDFCGGIAKAIRKTQNYLHEQNKKLKIEVEARTIDDVFEILNVGGVDRIMLDNFSIEETKEAMKIINGKIETESSGGITLKNIKQYAECGVDYISVGALTHQIKSLDISLKAIDF